MSNIQDDITRPLTERDVGKVEQCPISPSSKRNDQGDHECEELDEGAGPSKRWMTCSKNPGHKNFIPVAGLSIEDLPTEYRDTGVFELIRILSDLTVKVCVNYTSQNRPDGYIFSNFRGQTTEHTGTGFVVQCEFHDGINKDCPCPECVDTPDSLKPSRWWSVCVRTAQHVVFDEDEVKRTVITADLHQRAQGEGNDADPGKISLALHGFREIASDFKRDHFEMECVTHDKEAGQHLAIASSKLSSMRKLLCHTRQDDESWPPLSAIISYPHGFDKMVTVGGWIDRTVQATDAFHYNTEMTEYTYDTATCYGSSGAPVLVLGRGVSLSNVFGLFGPIWYHAHSGASSSRVGRSTVGVDCVLPPNNPSAPFRESHSS